MRIGRRIPEELCSILKDGYDECLGKGKGENKVDLVFFYASPLVKFNHRSGQYEPSPQLQWSKEWEDLKIGFRESKNRVRYMKCLATLSNFEAVLDLKPLALHFTCHGYNESNGSYLGFENPDASADLIH